MQRTGPRYECIDFLKRQFTQGNLVELHARSKRPAVGGLDRDRIGERTELNPCAPGILRSQDHGRGSRIDDHVHALAIHLRLGDEVPFCFMDLYDGDAPPNSRRNRFYRTRLQLVHNAAAHPCKLRPVSV